jgi:soluble lytic murein transglycosylase-like protein
MQLMAPTAAGLGVNPYDPEQNIQGGIKYDASLLKLWKSAASAPEQRNLALASYNAGPGNIERAVKFTAGPPEWSTARLFLPRITGPHASETLNYVARINGLMEQR